MANSNQEAMDALVGKLYNIIAAPDTITKVPKDTPFFSVCRPGIPITADALDFGFTTMTSLQEASAAEFSDIANDIPSLVGYWSPTGRKVFDEYYKVIRAPVLPRVTLTQQEQSDLDEARSFLYKDEMRLDLTTGRMVRVVVESLIHERYKEYLAQWEAAVDAYNTAAINYETTKDEPNAYTIWRRKETTLVGKVQRTKLALDGVAREVEEKMSFVANITGRGSNAIFAELRNRFNAYRNLDPTAAGVGGGGYYLFTKYFPQKFWEASAGTWQTFTFGHKEVHTVDTSSIQNWGGATGGRYGLWSWGGSVNRDTRDTYNESDVSNFDLSVEIARIPIRRTWMDVGVLSKKSWKFDNTVPQGEYLSDGENPPSGTMVAFPTAMIIARNLKLKIDNTNEKNSYSLEKISGSLRGGWGPFSLKGNYYRQTERRTHDFIQTGSGIESSGMQIIGFICQVLPKSPDPDAALPW